MATLTAPTLACGQDKIPTITLSFGSLPKRRILTTSNFGKAAQSSKSHADDTAIQAARTITDKTRIRITVELPVSKKDPRLEKEAACYMWDHLYRCIGREKRWIQTFHRLYGNWRAWYVFDHRLLPRSWVRIEDTATGEVLWTQDGLTHLGQSLIEKHEKDVEDLIVWRCTSKGVHRK